MICDFRWRMYRRIAIFWKAATASIDQLPSSVSDLSIAL